MKKNIVIFIILLTCLIILVLIYNNSNNNQEVKTVSQTFLEIGYTNEEIELINKYLSKSDIEYLINYEYVSNISEYLGYEIFDINNLERYINYRDLNSELDFYHTILYVNMNLDKNFYDDVKIVDNPNDVLVLINKYNRLPDDYVPNDLVSIDKRCTVKDEIYLRKEANENFYKMCIEMSSLNLDMKAISGYRSYEYQNDLFNNYVLKDGMDAAIKYSAKPRHSEHETGLTVDVMGNNKDYTRFSQTPEYRYIVEHASEYGFIIRYDNEFVTGYINEPWHLRYVGIEVANKIKKDNITLDEYIYLY